MWPKVLSLKRQPNSLRECLLRNPLFAMETPDDSLDYMRANRGVLARIARGIERGLRPSLSRALLYMPRGDVAFYIAEHGGELVDVDDIDQDPLPPDLEALDRSVLIDLSMDRLEVTMLAAARVWPELDSAQFTFAVHRGLLVEDGETSLGQLDCMELYGLPGVGDVYHYMFSMSEDGIPYALTLLCRYDEQGDVQVEDVAISVGAEEEEFHYRCRQLFGYQSEALRLLRGEFADEVDLDQTLGRLVASWPDGEPTEKQGVFMAELRDWALLQRESRAMRRLTGIDQLSTHKLQAIANYVETLIV